MESSYFSQKKDFKVKDGLGEESIVMLLQRMIVSNFARLCLLSRDDWKEMGEVALAYLRDNHPILAGGYAGARIGSFMQIVKVC